MPHSAISKRTRNQARALRHSPTDAERKLWYLLRSLKPLGMHFRRQALIGNYIADFVWHDGKLVIELDGSQHMDARRAYDERRTQWLQAQGYRVLRFWNNDVLREPRSVGEAILLAARDTKSDLKNPTPIPSPQGGGEPACASGEPDGSAPRAA
jgi:adenine-specific DNA-methyltransferase